MAHDHHHHHGPTDMKKVNTAFLIGIALNLIFVIVEIVSGFISNSLALLTDAGHNVSDIGSLVLSLLAFKLATRKPTDRFTYGYKKSTILASLFNAVVLLVAVGVILWESVKRFSHPAEIQGGSIAIVAGIGILINSVTALLFLRDKDKDLNIKGAYLHLMADALVSVGVVIGGIVISFMGYYWIDPVLSIVIGIVILISTTGLLKDSLKLSLDAVPDNVNIEKVKAAILETDGVKDMHHLHVWAISTTQNALTAHIVVNDALNMDEVDELKHRLKHTLEHLNILHATLEIEQGSHGCCEPGC